MSIVYLCKLKSSLTFLFLYSKNDSDNDSEPPAKKLKTIDSIFTKDYDSLEGVIADYSDVLSRCDVVQLHVSRESILQDSLKFIEEHYYDFPSRLTVC